MVIAAAALLAMLLLFYAGTRVGAAPAPVLLGAFADDNSGSGVGIQAGDRVTFQFDAAPDAFAITALNIDTALALNNGHTWLDGSGVTGAIVWSTSTFTNDTLTITLTVNSGAPGIAPGDTITIAPGTVRDTTSTNDAIGSPPNLSGSFGADVIIITPASLAPQFANEDDTGVVMQRLTITAITAITAITTTVVVTAFRIDRLGTATDTATATGGVKVYHDADTNGAVDPADTLLGSGSFLGGTVTITTPLVINTGAPRDVLFVLDFAGGAGTTLGVAFLNSSYVLVGNGDAVASSNFGILSSLTTIAALSPQLTGAIATDASGLGEGVQAGDTVALIFNGPTNAFTITGAKIDLTVGLNNGHVWVDGSGAIGSAVWSTAVFPNDTLTVTLSATTSEPTIAIGDSIALAGGGVRDITGTNNALGSPPLVTGSLGRDELTVAGVSVAPHSSNWKTGMCRWRNSRSARTRTTSR